MTDEIQVRLCPNGAPTFDVYRRFLRLPRRGESIIHGDPEAGDRYVVVEIDWHEDGMPFVIAHSADRPRAIEMLHK